MVKVKFRSLNSQNVLDLFSPLGAEYSTPTFFTDDLGFSIQRHYPTNLAFKSSVRADGTPCDLAGYWITAKLKPENEITVVVSVRRTNTWSIVRLGRYDYADVDCPTQSSLELSAKSRQPLEITEVFSYSETTKLFTTFRGESISKDMLLNKMFQKHCDTVHWLKGSELRIWQSLKRFGLSILDKTLKTSKWVAEKIFCQQLIEERNSIAELSGYKGIAPRDGNTVDVAGYKASLSTALILCSLVVAGTILHSYGLIQSEYVSSVLKSDALIVAHTIFVLAAIEFLPAFVILPIINGVIRLQLKLMLKPVRRFSFKTWFRPLVYIVAMFIFAVVMHKY